MELVPEEDGNPHEICDKEDNFMFTYASEDRSKWSTITICPWFLVSPIHVQAIPYDH